MLEVEDVDDEGREGCRGGVGKGFKLEEGLDINICYYISVKYINTYICIYI